MTRNKMFLPHPQQETFGEYLDALERKSFAIDIGAMITHGKIVVVPNDDDDRLADDHFLLILGPVRAYILGKRANASDRPGGPAKGIFLFSLPPNAPSLDCSIDAPAV